MYGRLLRRGVSNLIIVICATKSVNQMNNADLKKCLLPNYHTFAIFFPTSDLLTTIALAAVAVKIAEAAVGVLTVTIQSADFTGEQAFKPDSYVQVTAIGKPGEKKLKTSVVENSNHPVWNEDLTFGKGNWTRLIIEVYDEDKLSEDDIIVPAFAKRIKRKKSGKQQVYDGPEGQLRYLYTIPKK